MGCGASTEVEDDEPHSVTSTARVQGSAVRPVGQVSPHRRQQQSPMKDRQASPKSQQKQMEMTKETVERYLRLEVQVQQLERKDPINTCRVKDEKLADLTRTVQQLEQYYQQCVEQTHSEYADVEKLQNPSTKAFFTDQAQYEASMTKEQEEYLEAVNKQEIAKKELQGVTRQRDQLAAELQELKIEAAHLESLRNELDGILESIFDGSYGSERENRLEIELDHLLDKKQRVNIAKYKWQNGRVLIQYACNQLSLAVSRWNQAGQVDPRQMMIRYTMVTEARNNLIAANQNISNAQQYLHTIPFPYCTADEMKTLNDAIGNMYTDVQTPARYQHARECYTVMAKRAAALIQWFDQVINDVILKDLEKANIELAVKEREIRDERLDLMKEKYKEQTGAELDVGKHQSELISTERDDLVEDEMPMEADRVSVAGEIQKEDALRTETAPRALTPLPQQELAPPPKQEDIFGNVDAIKQEYEKNMEELAKVQESNKARLDQGLQEKLKTRRNRQKRGM